MFLSIVIPARNTFNNYINNYLQRLLNDIHESNNYINIKKDFQVIVVDDNSPCQYNPNFYDIPHKFIKNKERKNIGGSRNIGLDNAEGKYIWYFDADDEILPHTLDKIISLKNRAEKEDTEMIMLRFSSVKNTKYFDELGQEKIQPKYTDIKLDFEDYETCPISSCYKIIRRDKCIRHPENQYLEDVVYNFVQLDQITDKNHIIILNDVTYWIYDVRRTTNFTNTSHYLQQNQFTLKQHIQGGFLLKDPNLEWRAIGDLFITVGNMWNTIPSIKHNKVKNAMIGRFLKIYEKILLNNYTH